MVSKNNDWYGLGVKLLNIMLSLFTNSMNFQQVKSYLNREVCPDSKVCCYAKTISLTVIAVLFILWLLPFVYCPFDCSTRSCVNFISAGGYGYYGSGADTAAITVTLVLIALVSSALTGYRVALLSVLLAIFTILSPNYKIGRASCRERV